MSGPEDASSSGVHPATAFSARDYSGMAQLDSRAFLVVHDTKFAKDGPRIGIIRVTGGRSPYYERLKVESWNDSEGRSNDLESVCAVPGHPGEFLAAESGYRNGNYGRIFHIRVRGTTVRVLDVLKLPLLADNDANHVGDQFEGMICARHPGGGILVIMGERGGSELYKNGVLRWGWLDLATGTLTWTSAGLKGKTVHAPGAWIDPVTKRDIGDLHLDGDGTIWASATQDPGDYGPFRSVVYKLAAITGDVDDPIGLLKDTKASWVLDGFKVEGLSGAPAGDSGSPLSIATDDEELGGIWRPLSTPVTVH